MQILKLKVEIKPLDYYCETRQLKVEVSTNNKVVSHAEPFPLGGDNFDSVFPQLMRKAENIILKKMESDDGTER